MRERYLKLMELTLTGVILEDPPIQTAGYRQFLSEIVKEMSGRENLAESEYSQFKGNVREAGWDWPTKAFTMIGRKRLANFRMLIERVLREGVPGDIIETGVWRGGASIMAAAVMTAHDVRDRKIIVADSFEGLPPPDEAFPADSGSDLHEFQELAVSMEEVAGNFQKFDLLSDQVVFLKGWFRDTMPRVPSERLAIMRLDGDMYESTIDPLRHLYDKLSVGGWVIVDDYELFAGCKAAVHDFLGQRALTPEILPIDGIGVYFQKTAG
ncbi:MAG: TylF/MycF family methyltransferase [Parvibaculum sp.]|uniref:TylF/MycF/NovP-related O-methyltransferase n=1 Tax=Parvibaculum sp. TaxID=2024848 RepID=UPI0025E699E7|nr:TylF/MycF/NovP-related O-methyltransferase [Parvibaculum sp.]MCE9649750.1 TylF/MycF family methyltransferase [Parvibaculum sp.]